MKTEKVSSENENGNDVNHVLATRASRFNSGKLRWGLVDFDSIEEMVKVLEFGAKKYDEHNWKKGLPTVEICESMMRHIFAYLRGENEDTESGISHIGHILCNAMFLNYMQKNKPEFDNRFHEAPQHGG
jgi:hypothetical protein